MVTQQIARKRIVNIRTTQLQTSKQRRGPLQRKEQPGKQQPRRQLRGSPVLSIENLKKSFTTAHNEKYPILKGLNLTAKQGETIAIMGRSGSGKSTLISIITGLEKPDEGTVRIDDAMITELDESALTEFRARKIAIVFQQFHLISHLNALENVTLPLHLTGVKEHIVERAEDALAQLGLSHVKMQLPSQLSGGEQQRLAIARSLVVAPSLLLADEPTGNLDQETSKQVIAQLFNVVRKNNITLIIATHDLPLAKKCQSHYFLENGVLKAFK